MNRRQAIAGHKARLAKLTDTEARNLMEHAANKTPLFQLDEFCLDYSDSGMC